jgi:translation initiation factor IF-2
MTLLPSARISALHGTGLASLLRLVSLEHELLAPQADPNGTLEAAVVETQRSRGAGVSCTVVVAHGTVRAGDAVVAGPAWGRVRSVTVPGGRGDPRPALALDGAADVSGADNAAGWTDADLAAIATGDLYVGRDGYLYDVTTRTVQPRPGDPVSLLGLRSLPDVGDVVMGVDTEAEAREIAESWERQRERDAFALQSRIGGGDAAAAAEGGGHDDGGGKAGRAGMMTTDSLETAEVAVLIKCDVAGSVEAIMELCEPLATAEVAPRFVRVAVGAVSTGDIDVAHAAKATIFSFNVPVTREVRQYAMSLGVDVRTVDVVYRIEDAIREALVARLVPHARTVVHGHGEVVATFVYKISGSKATVAGTVCRAGKLSRAGSFAVFRHGELVHQADEAQSLKVHMKDVESVPRGQDCGLVLDGFRSAMAGDIVISYSIEHSQRVLGDRRIVPRDLSAVAAEILETEGKAGKKKH